VFVPEADVGSAVGLVRFLHLHELKVVAPVMGELSGQRQLLHQVHKLMGVALVREQLCKHSVRADDLEYLRLA